MSSMMPTGRTLQSFHQLNNIYQNPSWDIDIQTLWSIRPAQLTPMHFPPLQTNHQVTPIFCEGSIFHLDHEGNLSVIRAITEKKAYIEEKEKGPYEFLQFAPKQINLSPPNIPWNLPIEYKLGSFYI